MRTGQSVADALDGYVQLSTAEKVPTRSLIWCVGVRADPLVDGLDLDTNRGRLVVESAMSGNRMRVLADWALNATTPAEATSFGVTSAESVPLDPDKPRA